MGAAFIIMSDLHCNYDEIPEWAVVAAAHPGIDILVIAGDTENSVEHAAKVIAEAAEHFKHVIVTDGNHEHYENTLRNRSVVESTAEFTRLLAAIPNVTYLSPDGPGNVGIRIGDYRFLGCNGWYGGTSVPDGMPDIEFWKDRLNEDASIGFTSRLDPLPFHLARDHAAHLDAMLVGMSVCEPDLKAIVITHTAPIRDTLVTRPNDPTWNRMNTFYYNIHMQEVIDKHSDRIAVWCHGHTHFGTDIDRHGIRFVVNPRGYGFEAKNWSPVVIDPDAGDPWSVFSVE